MHGNSQGSRPAAPFTAFRIAAMPYVVGARSVESIVPVLSTTCGYDATEGRIVGKLPLVVYPCEISREAHCSARADARRRSSDSGRLIGY